MNWSAIQDSLKQRLHAIKNAGGDVAERDRVIALKKAISQHCYRKRERELALLGPRPPKVKEPIRHPYVVPAAMPDHIIVVDLEWNMWTQLTTEIGYTVYRNGVVESFNLCIGITGDRFAYGVSEYMDRDSAYERLKAECQAADLLVGHSFRNDLKHLASHGVLLEPKPFADTQRWQRAIDKAGKSAKLTDLCLMHGVEIADPHVGGNDARMTFEVFRKLLQSNQTD